MARSIPLTVLPTASALILTVAAATAAAEPAQPAAAGRPPHHVAGGFTNPGYGAHGAPPLRVTLPFFLRRAAATFSPPRALAARRIADGGERLRVAAERGADSVTWIGHSTLLVRVAGIAFLTDPVWSHAAGPVGLGPRRLVEPGLDLAELPAIDFAVVSHNHYDHMDLVTLERLDERGVRILVPLENAHTLEGRGITNIVELDWWQSVRIGGAVVHCVPARHWSRRGLFDMNASLWSGWLVEAGGKRLYFAGDTGMFDGFARIAERLGPIDLAAIPIGAYLPSEMMAPAHLDPDEAMRAVADLGAARSVAIHHGTFVLSDEPFDEPARRFSRASLDAGRGAALDWVMDVGETRPW